MIMIMIIVNTAPAGPTARVLQMSRCFFSTQHQATLAFRFKLLPMVHDHWHISVLHA